MSDADAELFGARNDLQNDKVELLYTVTLRLWTHWTKPSCAGGKGLCLESHMNHRDQSKVDTKKHLAVAICHRRDWCC